MLRTNFHTHTYRCMHAEGTEEDYVKAAVRCGLTQLGMSDHGPDPENSNRYKMTWEELDDYLGTLAELKKKYQGEIAIFSGFEYEYLDEFLPFLKELKMREDIDYFGLGPHAFRDSRGEFYNSFGLTHPREFMPYAKAVAQAMESGLYSFVAHPDIYVMNMETHCKEADEAAKIIAKASLDTGIPLEINANGMRKGQFMCDGVMRYPYPYWRFWDVVAEVGSKVIVGSDAHSPKDLCDECFVNAEKFAAERGITPIEFTGDML